MKLGHSGTTKVYIVVGPLSIYLWQYPWTVGRCDCDRWCCRWNFYFGPLGLEWAVSTKTADKMLNEDITEESAVVDRVNGRTFVPYDVDY
jgi:hypothetical protein